MSRRVDGLLLAGGRSRRFGSDKRFASFGASVLVEVALSKLKQAVSGTVYVAAGPNPERIPGAASCVRVLDAVPGAGPLAGIVAGLRHCRVGLLVLACDIPNVSPSTLQSLLRAGLRYDRVVAPRGRRGWEPLVAYYPARALTGLEAALRGGQLSAQPLLDRGGSISLGSAAVGRLHNVNRPGDLELAEALENNGGSRQSRHR